MERRRSTRFGHWRVTDAGTDGRVRLETSGVSWHGGPRPYRRVAMQPVDARRLGEALLEVADHAMKDEHPPCPYHPEGEHDWRKVPYLPIFCERCGYRVAQGLPVETMGHGWPEDPDPCPGEVWHVVLPGTPDGQVKLRWLIMVTDRTVELRRVARTAITGTYVDMGRTGKLYERDRVRFVERVQGPPREADEP